MGEGEGGPAESAAAQAAAPPGPLRQQVSNLGGLVYARSGSQIISYEEALKRMNQGSQ